MNDNSSNDLMTRLAPILPKVSLSIVVNNNDRYKCNYSYCNKMYC